MDFGLFIVFIGTVAANYGGFGGQQGFGQQSFGGQQPQIGYFRQGPAPQDYGPLAPNEQLQVHGLLQPLYGGGESAPIPTYSLNPAPSHGYILSPINGPAPPSIQPQSQGYNQGPPMPMGGGPVYPPSIPPTSSFSQNSVYIPGRRVRLIQIPDFRV